MAGVAWIAIVLLWLIGAAALFGIIYAAVRLAALSALKAHTRWLDAGHGSGGARPVYPAAQPAYPPTQPPYPGPQPYPGGPQPTYAATQPPYSGAQPQDTQNTSPTVPIPPPDTGSPPNPPRS